MDVEDVVKRKVIGLNVIKKSLSSIGLNICTPTLPVREAKSLSETLIEMRANSVIKNPEHERNLNCHEEVNAVTKPHISQIDEKGFETREVISNQIFLVKEEMLTYRGTRYSLSDIATKWKKDCRMWLWKSNKHKSVGELREKFQNVKLHN